MPELRVHQITENKKPQFLIVEVGDLEILPEEINKVKKILVASNTLNVPKILDHSDKEAILNKFKAEHRCEDHVVYLDPCADCIAKGRDCELATQGICSVCGEIVDQSLQEERKEIEEKTLSGLFSSEEMREPGNAWNKP